VAELIENVVGTKQVRLSVYPVTAEPGSDATN